MYENENVLSIKDFKILNFELPPHQVNLSVKVFTIRGSQEALQSSCCVQSNVIPRGTARHCSVTTTLLRQLRLTSWFEHFKKLPKP